jgi:hypothetical protein
LRRRTKKEKRKEKERFFCCEEFYTPGWILLGEAKMDVVRYNCSAAKGRFSSILGLGLGLFIVIPETSIIAFL